MLFFCLFVCLFFVFCCWSIDSSSIHEILPSLTYSLQGHSDDFNFESRQTIQSEDVLCDVGCFIGQCFRAKDIFIVIVGYKMEEGKLLLKVFTSYFE